MKLRENTITRIGLWLFVMLLCSNAVVGQTASMNYVRKSQMTAPYTSNPLIDFENARFRDTLLAGTFLQQDPLAEKYYGFSPYHYGTCNPLRFMDFDGRKVVYSNDMSDSERFNLMETIANLRDSQLFSKVYDYREKMKNIVTISFGETVKDQYGDNVAGQYVPNESDGGGTITFKDENSLSSFVAAEEIYHSY